MREVVACHERYLDLPTVIGKNHSKPFQAIRERIQNRMEGWHGRLLSMAGKEEVLIKALL